MQAKRLENNGVIWLLIAIILCCFSGQAIQIVFGVTCLYIIQKRSRLFDFKEVFFSKTSIYVLIFLFYCSISYFWSIDQAKTLSTSLRTIVISLFGITAFALVDDITLPKAKENTAKIATNLVIALNLLMICEHSTGYFITRNLRELFHITREIVQPLDKATAFFTCILPAVFIYLKSNKIHFKIMAFTTMLNYAVHPMFAAFVAILFADLVLLLFKKFGKTAVKYLFLGMILFGVLSPMIFKQVLSSKYVTENIYPKMTLSWQIRMDMWNGVEDMVKKHSLAGYGMNSSSKIDGNYQFFENDPNKAFSAHPHNIFLQLWVELGAIGVLLFSVMIYMLYQYIMLIEDEDYLKSILAIVASYIAFASLSFSIWQSWWICVLFLSLIFARSFSNKLV